MVAYLWPYRGKAVKCQISTTKEVIISVSCLSYQILCLHWFRFSHFLGISRKGNKCLAWWINTNTFQIPSLCGTQNSIYNQLITQSIIIWLNISIISKTGGCSQKEFCKKLCWVYVLRTRCDPSKCSYMESPIKTSPMEHKHNLFCFAFTWSDPPPFCIIEQIVSNSYDHVCQGYGHLHERHYNLLLEIIKIKEFI